MSRVYLQDWVKEQGSISVAAGKLGVPASTLSAYCRCARFPHPRALREMLRVIGSSFDISPLVAGWVMNQDSTRRRARRLRSELSVSTVDRLCEIYSELGLNTGGIETAAPKILPRWQTTKVTVGEVRDAIASLQSSRRNPSDLSLIHESIGNSRTARLRSLSK